LSETLNKGDSLVFKHDGVERHKQEAFSIHVDREPADVASAGKTAGLKVTAPVSEGDMVYVVSAESVIKLGPEPEIKAAPKVVTIKKPAEKKPAKPKIAKKKTVKKAAKKAVKKIVKKKAVKKAAKKSKKR
jgi:hypothetical protein